MKTKSDPHGHAVQIAGYQWNALSEEAAGLRIRPTALLSRIITQHIERESLKVLPCLKAVEPQAV
jgi:hypothetical protein